MALALETLELDPERHISGLGARLHMLKIEEEVIELAYP